VLQEGGARLRRIAVTRRREHASEAILISIACLSPWAFGSVEAWAQLVLDVGVLFLAFLWAFGERSFDRRRAISCVPSVALSALVLLAVLQVVPLSEGVLRALSPGTARLRSSLIPRAAERIGGDVSPPVPLPSATLSQDPEATIHAAAWLGTAWIVFQSAVGLPSRRGALRRFSLAVSINAAALALYSLVQALTWNGKIYGWRASPYNSAGPFVSHNHLAAYLNLGLGLTLGFLVAPGEAVRGRKLWSAYAAALIVVGIVVSLSRSGFLALTGASLVLFLVWRPRGVRLWLSLGVLALLIPLLLIMVSQAAPFQDRLASLLTSKSYGERAQIWRDAIRAWPSVPIWGTGLGSFAAAAAPFIGHATGVKYTHAENEYIEWLVEGGIIGVGLGIAFVAGIIGLGRQAWQASSSRGERALILGAVYSGLSLLIQSMGDFAPHIPAIGLTAIILAGLIVRRGLAARSADLPQPMRPPWAARRALAEVAIVFTGLIVVFHGLARARAEVAIFKAGIGLRDNGPLARIEYRLNTSPDSPAATAEPELGRMREALEEALRLRPSWAEGHLRLGLIRLHDYELYSVQAISARVDDPAARLLLASPLWLNHVIHSYSGTSHESLAELLSYAPIREHLVPAARSFLEARRCCPVLALPHAELATLDYLLVGGDPGPVYAERALRLAGSNGTLIALATQLAVQEGAPGLAAQGLRKALQTQALDWTDVADLAGGILAPAQILQEVVPDSRTALAFSDRLYTMPEAKDIRRTFLEAALKRLPGNRALSPAERLELEAQLWERLENRSRAQDRMQAALTLEPRRATWRKELVSWLIAWGHLREAHDQALVGFHYAPERPEMRAALDMAAEAFARGTAPALPVNDGARQ
jgi:O-antigen ligase